jgi:hypothetical protein
MLQSNTMQLYFLQVIDSCLALMSPNLIYISVYILCLVCGRKNTHSGVMCRNEYFVICFFRTLRNNEISSLLKNSLDTFTNLVKLYVDENLFLKQFRLLIGTLILF